MNDPRSLLWIPFLGGIVIATAGFLRGYLVEERRRAGALTRFLIVFGCLAVFVAVAGWSWVIAGQPTFCLQCECC